MRCGCGCEDALSLPCCPDCTSASSRICPEQSLTWRCVCLPLSAPSVTLRLFDSQARKNTTFFGRRIFTTALLRREPSSACLWNQRKRWEKEGNSRGGLPSFQFLGRLREARRHPSAGRWKGDTVSSQTLVWGRGLVVLRRGCSKHVLRISCGEGLIVPSARTGWLRSGWQSEQKDSLYHAPADWNHKASPHIHSPLWRQTQSRRNVLLHRAVASQSASSLLPRLSVCLKPPFFLRFFFSFSLLQNLRLVSLNGRSELEPTTAAPEEETVTRAQRRRRNRQQRSPGWRPTGSTSCITWPSSPAPCTRSPLTPCAATPPLTFWPAATFSANLEQTFPKRWLHCVSNANRFLSKQMHCYWNAVYIGALLKCKTWLMTYYDMQKTLNEIWLAKNS